MNTNTRQKFEFEGRTIYQWDQTIDDVHIYIEPPKCVLEKYKEQVKAQLQPGQQMPKLQVTIKNDSLQVGIKGADQLYLNEKLERNCDSSESYWMIEDEELHIILQKGLKADLWPCVFKGHGKIDPLTQEETKKKLLLERFQSEHPGFDFSQAQFNGMAPDAREFLGGIKYN